MINLWTGLGRLTGDPTTGTTQSGTKYARFSVAIDRPKRKDAQDHETDFISCTAWAQKAEFVEQYLHKGMKVCVQGRIQTGSYEKNGQKIYTTDIFVETIEFADGKRQEQNVDDLPPGEEDIMNIPDSIDEQLPFK